MNVPARLARWMATSAEGIRDGSNVAGGQYVTLIARYLGLDVPNKLKTCTLLRPGMRLLGAQWFVSNRLVTTDKVC